MNSYKSLGQSAPSATTLTTLYTVPSGFQTVCDGLRVCNRSAASTTFRIAESPLGVAIADEAYHYYDLTIDGYDTFECWKGKALGSGTVVRIYAGNANLSFNLSGVEIS